MKKILLALLLLGMLAGCAQQAQTIPETEPAETPSVEIQTVETATSETAAPAAQEDAEYLEDFTVDTADGAQFRFSEALASHELVVINLFATWCGPCAMEFPYLQQAWEQSEEQVAVIALSIEPTDTLDVLRQYEQDMGLRLPMGSAEGTGLSRFVTVGIPTTVLVDRTGKVVGVEIGAQSSTEAFLELFDNFTGEDYDPSVCLYTVHVTDLENRPVAGAVVNFCTDTTCTPVTTDLGGTAIYEGPAAQYHVQLLSVPDGWQILTETEFITQPYADELWFYAQRGAS